MIRQGRRPTDTSTPVDYPSATTAGVNLLKPALSAVENDDIANGLDRRAAIQLHDDQRDDLSSSPVHHELPDKHGFIALMHSCNASYVHTRWRESR